MVTTEVSFFRNRPYIAVSLTHFFVDVLNNSRTLLVAILALSVGLTNAQVGLALLLYNVGSSLAQPLFGFLADRFGPRWLVVGGMGWMIAMYGFAALAWDWPALVAITLAGLGSGAFHPTGTMVASDTSQVARTQATALFFTSGQIGLFAGPIVAGALIQSFGRQGYTILPLLALIAFVGGYRWLTNDPPQHPAEKTTEAEPRGSSRQIPWRTVLPLATIIMTTSTVTIGAMNFAPKLFAELGYSPVYAGWTAGLIMLGSALGGMVGGALGDRIGYRPTIRIGMLGAILPIYFYVPIADPWRFIMLALAGFFMGMPHSVLVILAQSLLPGRRAFASGLILGLMFFSGAVGSYFLGVIADSIGLGVALQGTFLVPILAVVVSLALPGRQSMAKAAAA